VCVTSQSSSLRESFNFFTTLLSLLPHVYVSLQRDSTIKIRINKLLRIVPSSEITKFEIYNILFIKKHSMAINNTHVKCWILNTLSDLFRHLNEPDIQTIAGLSTNQNEYSRSEEILRWYWFSAYAVAWLHKIFCRMNIPKLPVAPYSKESGFHLRHSAFVFNAGCNEIEIWQAT